MVQWGWYSPDLISPNCRSGGTGRRQGLKIPWEEIPVPVQVRSPAPNFYIFPSFSNPSSHELRLDSWNEEKRKDGLSSSSGAGLAPNVDTSNYWQFLGMQRIRHFVLMNHSLRAFLQLTCVLFWFIFSSIVVLRSSRKNWKKSPPKESTL